MTESFRIPRVSLVWVLASLTAVILPHAGRMPPWLTLLCAACILVRVLIHQGRLSFPGNRIKLPAVILVAATVLAQYGRSVFSTDAAMDVLIVGLALKLLEMQRKRDVLLVIYLCYFTLLAEFIYSQSIPIAAYTALCVVLTTSALMSLYQGEEGRARPARTLRLAALMTAQGVPVMLALFVLFPRIPPLWSVPMPAEAATTGLSETMSPGDIGNLIRSGEVAFRVQFHSEVPPNADLYWRGLTLDEFDGREWSRFRPPRRLDRRSQRLDGSAREIHDWFRRIEFLGEPVEYDVILEPTHQNWLFTLKMPRMSGEGLVMGEDFQVESNRRIAQRYSYQATSYRRYRAGLEPEQRVRRRSLRLPREGHARAREFAGQLSAQTGGGAAYIDAVLDYFREQEFFYTLSPAVLQNDYIDEFLFSTREGFCEHYAGAFTFLMRAAGIPARVVTGYQGGEINPYDGTLIVRQYDAHAWSEVWLEGQGWIRVDPTAAVAPERIDLGSELALERQQGFLEDAGFSMLRFRNNLFMNDLRLRLEMIDYAWNRWVLNFNQDLQMQMLRALFGGAARLKGLLALFGLLLALAAAAALAVIIGPSRTPLPPATALYLRFCKSLARLGFERRTGETPEAYCRRLSLGQPQWAGRLAAITDTYVDIAFRGQDQGASEKVKVRELKKEIRGFRRHSLLNLPSGQ